MKKRYKSIILGITFSLGLLSQCTNHDGKPGPSAVVSSGVSNQPGRLPISKSIEQFILDSPYSMQQLDATSLDPPAIFFDQDSGLFGIQNPDGLTDKTTDPDRADWDFLELCIDTPGSAGSCSIGHHRSWTLDYIFYPLEKGDYQVQVRACVGEFRIKDLASSCGSYSKAVTINVPTDSDKIEYQKFSDEMDIFKHVTLFFDTLTGLTTDFWASVSHPFNPPQGVQDAESFVRSLSDLVSIGPYRFMNLLMEKDPIIMELTNRFRDYDYVFAEAGKIDESSCHFFDNFGLTEGLALSAGLGALTGVMIAYLSYMKHRYQSKKLKTRISQLDPNEIRKLNLRQDLYFRLDKALDHSGWQRNVNTLTFKNSDGTTKKYTFSRNMSPAERLTVVNQVITQHNSKYYDNFTLKSTQDGSPGALRNSLANFDSGSQSIDLKTLKKTTNQSFTGNAAKAAAIGSVAGLAVGMTIAYSGNQMNLTTDQRPKIIESVQKECFVFLQQLNKMIHHYDQKYLK